ncbi:8-oxo-dGTP pyrophosphatase MutT (NUDIX family) [Bradyrhizobium sp. USDA 3696]
MTDTSQAADKAKIHEGKEADHYPYFRPRDAATLILVDRSGAIPKVLVGKRHDKVVFMPGKFVFPGGRVDKDDYRVPCAAPITAELEANLAKGSPKTPASRAKSLAIAAIREACEETGLCLGRKAEGKAKLEGAWKPFADAGLLPDPSSLFLIARAITPPGRVKRFDTRFFTADASAITPSRRRRDPCRCRACRTGLGRARLEAARRSASDDTQCAQRARRAPRHRPAPPRCAGAVLPFLRRQDAEGYFELISS